MTIQDLKGMTCLNLTPEQAGAVLGIHPHTIANICRNSPASESLHYTNRRRGVHKVRIINDDPHFEEVDRYVLG